MNGEEGTESGGYGLILNTSLWGEVEKRSTLRAREQNGDLFRPRCEFLRVRSVSCLGSPRLLLVVGLCYILLGSADMEHHPERRRDATKHAWLVTNASSSSQ